MLKTDRSRNGGIDEIPLTDLPHPVNGRLWLCGKHKAAPDPDALLKETGATTMVCLVQPHEIEGHWPHYPLWLRANAPERAVWFQVPDLNALPLDSMMPFFEDLSARLTRGEGLIVHCAAGIGRSGTTAVALLTMHGMHLTDALTHVRAHRPMAGPEVGAQMDLVRAIGAYRSQ